MWRWIGIGETDDVMLSVVSGRLFTTASASHMNVRRASSFSWLPFSKSGEDSSYCSNLSRPRDWPLEH